MLKGFRISILINIGDQVERRSTVSAKHFAEQLNKSLDELGVPNSKERPAIFSKMLDIPRQLAWNLIEGYSLPDPELFEKIVNELELDPNLLRDLT